MATLAEVYALALQYHQAGHLPQAEQLYQQILQANPNHADTHHLLGVLDYQMGRHDQAVKSIRYALALNPSAAGYYCNLGLAYQALGKTAEAAAAYEQVLRLEPQSAEAHCVLGNLLAVLGRLDEAVRHCQEALRFRPGFAGAHNNLGLALSKQGKLDEAVVQFQLAVQFDPHYAAAHTNLGQAWNNLGIARLKQGRLDEARACFEQALQLKPDQLDAHYNLGSVLMEQGRLDEAVACYQQALRLKPDYPEVLYNLGNAFLLQNKLDEASRSYQQALQLQPKDAAAWNNLGSVHKRQGQFDAALACFERTLGLDPAFAQAHWNRAVVLLLGGDFEQGWPEYEWRWTQPWLNDPPAPARTGTKGGSRQFAQPLWDGSDLGGRTILLYAEQGLGDTMHFIRYAPLVRQRGGRVIVECQRPLLPLLANVPGVDRLVAPGSPLPAFDVQAPLAGLPGIFRTVEATMPATIPYLQAKAELVAHWRKSRMSDVGCPMPGEVLLTSDFRLSTSDFLVGIAWQGNPAFMDDWQRSMPLAQFAPLAQVPGVQLISLQKGPGTEQLHALEQRVDSGQWTVDSDAKTPSTVHRPPFTVHHLGSRLDEANGAFMDTAAIMTNIDLVVTSDSAVPHLAGALGVPVWVALAFVPDWRWLLRRKDSPWYPTMRLFRQRRDGHWEDVFERMAEELKALVAGGSG